MRDVVTSTCTPSQLINNLRVAYGKKHVLLLIDEITYAIDSMRPLNATLSKNIIESIASLQNDDLISTFFTTKSLQPFYEA
jgi:ABC-type glutathione transport system ATPase component